MTTRTIDTATPRQRGWTVVMEYRARSALRQLSAAEREAIGQALEDVAQHGWDPHHPSYLEVRTLRDEHGPYFRLRLRTAPDVDLFARVSDDQTLTVIDVLRTELLRHVAEAF